MIPEIGTELIYPTRGTRTVFTATAASTAGSYVEVEATYPPNGEPPPRHLHPAQDEHFTVLSGRIRYVRDDETAEAGEGDEFEVPRGVAHQMWSPGPEGAVLRWRISPALQTGEMFCELWQLSRNNGWAPTPAQLFGIVSNHSAEFQLC
jgi:mannose-6-phosphate isomerase-like protein (cupin superfamily)